MFVKLLLVLFCCILFMLPGIVIGFSYASYAVNRRSDLVKPVVRRGLPWRQVEEISTAYRLEVKLTRKYGYWIANSPNSHRTNDLPIKSRTSLYALSIVFLYSWSSQTERRRTSPVSRSFCAESSRVFERTSVLALYVNTPLKA